MSEQKRANRIRVLRAEAEVLADRTADPLWRMIVRILEALQELNAIVNKRNGVNDG